MIIIIEGENKCGKSTLAREIMSNFKFNYLKFSQPKKDPFIEYMEALEYIEKLDGDWIFDRFYLGEMVYGPLYREKAGLTLKQQRAIEKRLHEMNTVIFYCVNDIEKIEKMFIEDGEEFAEKEKIKKTLELFGEQIESIKDIIPVYTHKMKTENDYTTNGKLVSIIKKHLILEKWKETKI